MSHRLIQFLDESIVEDLHHTIDERAEAAYRVLQGVVTRHAPKRYGSKAQGGVLVYCTTCGSGEPHEYPEPWPCADIRAVMSLYRDWPGYREALA